MANFDLGEDLRLVRAVGVAPSEAYARSQDLLRGYEALGYRVRFTAEDPERELVAEISDRAGTRIVATAAFAPQGAGTSVELRLRGVVHVGGVKGMLANERQVRQVASERLADFVAARFPPGEVAPAAPAPAEPQPAEPAPASSPASGSLEHRLTLVRELFERGLIDEADFRAKKARLLEEA